MTKFADLGLPETLLRALVHEGYTNPTSIQAQAVPHLLQGRDLLGIAQTGTGKTAAFALPILARLIADRRRHAPFTARALILAPTRELAAQIGDSLRRSTPTNPDSCRIRAAVAPSRMIAISTTMAAR